MKFYLAKWKLAIIPILLFLLIAQVPDNTDDNIQWYSNRIYFGELDHSNTANRTWSFPDIDGIVLLAGSTQSVSNKILSDVTINSVANINNATITGGTITGLATPLEIASGGTNSSTLDNFILESMIASGSVGTRQIADGAITEPKLAAQSITGDSIVDGSITSAKFQTGQLGASLLGDNVITTDKIANRAVTGSKVATRVITASHIAQNTISGLELAASSVTSSKIQNLAVTQAKLAGSSVTTAKISNGTIQLEDLASGVASMLGGSGLTSVDLFYNSTQNGLMGITRANLDLRDVVICDSSRSSGTVYYRTRYIALGSTSWSSYTNFNIAWNNLWGCMVASNAVNWDLSASAFIELHECTDSSCSATRSPRAESGVIKE